MMLAFILSQSLVVLFVALHDWLPLGRLNNLAGIRAVDTRAQLLRTTIVSTAPFAVGLAGTIRYYPGPVHSPLVWVLWISYGAGLYGMLRAWYFPYLVYADPLRAARYHERFAHTHAFLPVRNGIRPDTLHVIFHVVLLTTIALLVALTASGELSTA
jgi:hypothetical protein